MTEAGGKNIASVRLGGKNDVSIVDGETGQCCREQQGNAPVEPTGLELTERSGCIQTLCVVLCVLLFGGV